ncbi:toll-like receptor 4 [Amphiura filiformis]|uniref:toll-like receptor 4 n=1 Tax=Amphiura filiformis TaxID=82378 RepID=UPI003B218B40
MRGLVQIFASLRHTWNHLMRSATIISFQKTNSTCPFLETLDFSECFLFNYNGNADMELPVLQRLYLNKIRKYPDLAGVLNIFKAPRLQRLELSSNGIVNIENKLFTHFSSLTFLDLSNNKLVSVSNLQYLSNIRQLSLHDNSIKIVPQEILIQSGHPNMSILDISNNPFQCDCNVEAFRNWILTDNMVKMVMLADSKYTCFSPDSEKDLSITQVDLDCELHLWKYISIGIACAVVLLISVILIVRYWWHIKYSFFLVFNRRRNQQHHLIVNAENIDDDENGPPRYDAYVPYHVESADDWVHGELLPNIEEGEEPFRLFLRCRDMRIGRIILDEISLHMQRSRKVLVILTPRFFEDNWCLKELEMAHYRVLEENRNVMILIILGQIPNNKKTLLFRQLLCKVQYLKWPGDAYGQYLFWRRLREELKRPVPLDRRFNV